MESFDNILSIIVGLMSIFIVLYRIFKFMLPMLISAIKEKNHYKAFASFTQLV